MVIKCPKCKHYVSDTTAVCPHCGEVLKANIPTQTTEAPAAKEEVSKPVNETPVSEPTEALQPEPVIESLPESAPHSTPQASQAEEVQPPHRKIEDRHHPARTADTNTPATDRTAVGASF